MTDTPGPDRQPRQNVLLSAELAGFGGGPPTKHRIRDLSSTGARLDRASALKAGATVLVSVGVLEQMGATVVWVKGDVAGLKFVEAIDPDAARSRTIVSTSQKPALARGATKRQSDLVGGFADGPSAGWLPELNNPYRK